MTPTTIYQHTKSAKRPSQPTGEGQIVWTERRKRLIAVTYRYRAVTSAQLEALEYTGRFRAPGQKANTRCQYDLTLLSRAKFLAAEEQPTTRGEGAKPRVYFLAERGAWKLAELWDVHPSNITWRPRDNDVLWPYLHHELRTGDIRIALTLGARRQGWQVSRWISDRALRSKEMKEYVTVKTERKDDQGAVIEERERKVAVVPDGLCELEVPQADGSARVYYRAVECDLANTTSWASSQARRDWALKARSLLRWHSSGAFAQRYSTGSRVALRVLCVTTTDAHLTLLKKVTYAVGGRQLFLFTTFSRLTQPGVNALTDPIWERPGSETLRPCVE